MPVSLESINDGSSYDVVIVGAGMVGASAAIGFADLGMSVLLVDAFSFPEPVDIYTPSYDERSTALSSGTQEVLCRLGVWNNISKHACPISNIHVSEQGRFGTLKMSAEEFDQTALGYVVSNKWFGQCLLKRIAEQEIIFCAPVKVSNIVLENENQYITLGSTGALTKKVLSKLVLIVDGSNSETAQLLGIEHSVEDYHQQALVANVSTELPNNGVAYERFTSEGPLAVLPLTESTSSVVWTHDEHRSRHFQGLDDAGFCRELEQVFGERLGRIVACGKRQSYSLKIIRAVEECRSGVLLLGNAAHSLHPVAGQGFNLAIRSVASLLEMVKASVSSNGELNSDYSSLKSLNQLCQSRLDDKSKTIFMSDQLIKIFGHPSFLVGVARDIGLVGLDNSPIFKSMFASRAMGLSIKKARF